MRKVGVFRSIHVKIVLIYVLLILIAMQIIGIYFIGKLETTLKSNFTSSVADRMSLVEFSVREEMLKERTEDDLTLEESLNNALLSFDGQDVNGINIIYFHCRHIVILCLER